MSYTLSQIATLINAEATGAGDASIQHLLLDSRKLIFPDTSLFFALKGSSTQGSEFIIDLYGKGLRHFVVSQEYTVPPSLEGAIFLKVKDVLHALQTLATYHRHQFNYPVIGITGSNGKTIVKEWLYQLLNEDLHIVRNPKSYNSQIGVPLSVWLMNETHQLGIFEAGISKPGEMLNLQKIIDPEIGIISFVGDAHAENFPDKREKIIEKLKLFSNSKVLIYHGDDDLLKLEVDSAFASAPIQLLEWSFRRPAAYCYMKEILKHDLETAITGYHDGIDFNFSIPFTDDASIFNAITCVTALLHMGVDKNIIATRTQQLKQVAMRLELKQGINSCAIINDSYSADINSLVIALDFLQQQQQHDRRTMVLSDMLQTGRSSDSLYNEIADLVKHHSIYRFVGVGEQISAYQSLFSQVEKTHFYPDTESFIHDLPLLNFREETILLKGARIFKFEKISRMLEQKIHETFMEIDLNALRNNLRVYRQQLRPGVKLMAMVKAFSYGSGSFEIASLLQHAGANYLGVAYADEGVELRKAGIKLPIMVMNTEEAGFDNIVRYRLEPELYSFRILRSFKNYLRQQGIRDYPVHIKLDTGMHRLGFEESDMSLLLQELKDDCIRILSVFSHLVGSDDPLHDAFTQQQSQLFLSMNRQIAAHIGYPFLTHLGNSSAIHRHKELQLDMVRLGIGLYGVDPFPTIQLQLENVTTLKTTISQIRKVRAGESVGYSRSGVVDKDAMVATVRIGYADGYPRVLGNGKGKMLVNGQLAPVIGNVCMDMTMLDITGIEAEEEDHVMVFGEGLPVTLVAEWAGTIPYEILTNISQRVKRVYYEE